MRNPSPISINSPRETIVSPSRDSSFSTSRIAAALLLTTMAGAPRSCSSSSPAWMSRLPRPPAAGSYSRLEYPPAVSRIASIAEAASGARPRFVCKITPEALMTRRSEGRVSRVSLAVTRALTAARPSNPSGCSPARMAARISARRIPRQCRNAFPRQRLQPLRARVGLEQRVHRRQAAQQDFSVAHGLRAAHCSAPVKGAARPSSANFLVIGEVSPAASALL